MIFRKKTADPEEVAEIAQRFSDWYKEIGEPRKLLPSEIYIEATLAERERAKAKKKGDE